MAKQFCFNKNETEEGAKLTLIFNTSEISKRLGYYQELFAMLVRSPQPLESDLQEIPELVCLNFDRDLYSANVDEIGLSLKCLNLILIRIAGDLQLCNSVYRRFREKAFDLLACTDLSNDTRLQAAFTITFGLFISKKDREERDESVMRLLAVLFDQENSDESFRSEILSLISVLVTTLNPNELMRFFLSFLRSIRSEAPNTFEFRCAIAICIATMQEQIHAQCGDFPPQCDDEILGPLVTMYSMMLDTFDSWIADPRHSIEDRLEIGKIRLYCVSHSPVSDVLFIVPTSETVCLDRMQQKAIAAMFSLVFGEFVETQLTENKFLRSLLPPMKITNLRDYARNYEQYQRMIQSVVFKKEKDE